MTSFFQAAAAVLVAVILILSIRGQGKDLGLLLSLFVCCSVGCIAMAYLKPVIAFVQQLRSLGNLDSEMLAVLLKVVGTAMIGEIAALVCVDAGNAAMGKALQILTVATILWLSLPMFTALLDLVETILGNV